MFRFLNLTLNGVALGMIYAAVALALVMIWRATRIVNFAQGAMLMITTLIASAVIGSNGSYWLAFFVAPVFVVIAAITAGNVISAGFLPRYCPPELMGRVTTAMQVVNFGAIPIVRCRESLSEVSAWCSQPRGR